MTKPSVIDVQNVIDNAAISPVQRRAIGLSMAVAMFDGFDALLMAVSAPSIAEQWGTTTASLTPAILASLVGMIVGAVFLVPRADRYGRRPLQIAGVALFGLMTLAVVAAQDVGQIVVLRFLAGIGLGAVLPNSFAYGAEFAPKRKRVTIVTVIGASSAAGGFLGGLLATALIPEFGWRSVFFLGGVLPLLLVLALIRWLPDTVQFLTLDGQVEKARSLLRSIDPRGVDPSAGTLVIRDHGDGNKPSIAVLFTRRFAPTTLLLGVVFFHAVLLTLFLMSWLPSVFAEAGLPTNQALAASSACNLGAMFGGVVIGTLADRRKSPNRLPGLCFSAAIVGIAVTALSLRSFPFLLVTIFAVGAFAIGTQMCVNAVATDVYPSWMRATGIGVLSGIGKVGSVVGPAIGGALLAAQVPAKTIFLLAIVPATVAAAAMIAVGPAAARSRRRPPVVSYPPEADDLIGR
ncbi:MFS transporter [Nocardia sp. NPDC019395]|uniref:MFS transporter n=1 Tax=Nocardia sp. NPDC019395 TaxID=3154686 RepID=UPI0033F92D6F